MNAASQEKKLPPKEAASPNVIGPVATRMIDDALFAILGTPREALENKPAPAASAESSPLAGGANILKPRVVRTSAKLGFWARVAGGLVLCASAFGIGYVAALAPGSASPEVVREEIKGIATELERGGLAALRSAEERLQDLVESNPEISPLMNGALAETLSRRYARFGHSDTIKTRAMAALEAAGDKQDSLEKTIAHVMLSTAAADLAQLDKELEKSLLKYPESPKAWVARAELARRSGQTKEVIAHLTQARAIHPNHRQTLLETARWLAREGAVASSLETYALVQNNSDVDVEVAIERYLLGWATRADSAHPEAVSLLAGLVRSPIPEVAPDEVGRAAFAFAFGHLQDARVDEAMASLAEAAKAYPDSAEYQHTVGRVFLAIGKTKSAEACFIRATEAAPNNPELWMDVAKARFARALKLGLSSSALERRLTRLKNNQPKGRLKLPLGEVKVSPSEFRLVDVTLEPAIFREEDFLPIREATARGVPFEEATKVLLASAVARDAMDSGNLSKARRVVDRISNQDREHPDSVSSLVLRAELYLKQDRYRKAQTAIQQAIGLDTRLVSGRAPQGINELSSEFLMQMGRIVLKNDRKQGLRLLRLAVKRPSAPPSVHFFLGKALVTKRKTRREGRRSLKKYLELDPNGSHATEAKRLRRRK